MLIVVCPVLCPDLCYYNTVFGFRIIITTPTPHKSSLLAFACAHTQNTLGPPTKTPIHQIAPKSGRCARRWRRFGCGWRGRRIRYGHGGDNAHGNDTRGSGQERQDAAAGGEDGGHDNDAQSEPAGAARRHAGGEDDGNGDQRRATGTRRRVCELRSAQSRSTPYAPSTRQTNSNAALCSLLLFFVCWFLFENDWPLFRVYYIQLIYSIEKASHYRTKINRLFFSHFFSYILAHVFYTQFFLPILFHVFFASRHVWLRKKYTAYFVRVHVCVMCVCACGCVCVL